MIPVFLRQVRLRKHIIWSLLVVFQLEALADQYLVAPDGDDPLSANMVLTVEPDLERDTHFELRALGGIPSAVTQVRCLDSSDVAVAKLIESWRVAKSCNQIAWTVGFESYASDGFELASQASFYHPKGWWFLNESSSLLRRRIEKSESTVCGSSTKHMQCNSLSMRNAPPTFLIFGQPEVLLQWDNLSVEVFVGVGAEKLDLSNLLEELRIAFDKLDSLFARDATKARHLQIAWLETKSRRQVVAGAAGAQAFLANFRSVDGEVTNLEQTRLLMVSAHEYVHVLGVQTGELWATESLATYYGFKVLSSRNDAKTVFEQMAYVDHPDAPLILRGAGLWQELDEQIQRSSNHRTELKDYVSLLSVAFPEERQLPRKFTKAVAIIIGQQQLQAILSRYL